MFKPAGNQIKRKMTAGFKHKNLFGNQNLQACHFTFSGALILAHPKLVGYLLLLDCGPLSSSKCCMCEWQPRQPDLLIQKRSCRDAALVPPWAPVVDLWTGGRRRRRRVQQWRCSAGSGRRCSGGCRLGQTDGWTVLRRGLAQQWR